MPPIVQFVTTADGVRIAYRTLGAGHPLIFVRGWVSHLGVIGQEPRSRAFFEALAGARTLVQYDARGNGLSDRDVRNITLPQLVLDLAAVVDRLGLNTFDLYGQCFGGPIAIRYAASHPERVSRLILDGTYARGGDITTKERQAALLAGIRTLWPAATKILDHLTVPHPDAGTGYVASNPEAVSAEVAAELYRLAYRIDVTGLLPKLKSPALVLHRRGSQAIPFTLGLQLASQIPNARFVALDGTSHNPWGGDTPALLDALGDFLGARLLYTPPPSPRTEQGPVTILFTDIAGSTALTQRLGDAAAQQVLRAHNAIVSEAIENHGGTLIKNTGDGVMASFAAASRAIECAIAIQRAVSERTAEPGHDFYVRIGLNAGEPVAEDGDLFGTAVQLAARVCSAAAPGEILASNVVRELASGKGFLFSDHGDTVLRGFEDPVRLYVVRGHSLDA